MRIPDHDLSDFMFSSSPHPLDPDEDFKHWLDDAAGPLSLYEPILEKGAAARTELRAAAGSQPVINLTSYNYLGLAQHPEVIEAGVDALRILGTGACGSPMLSGLTGLHEELARELASFLGKEAAMLFSSGTGGAVGMLAATLSRGDVAIMDELAHICLIEGARLAGAKIEFFAHNDPHDLNAKLTKHSAARRVVLVEGLYSMHGDYGRLAELVPVAKAHDVDIVVDEAHSILACGPTGRGAAEMCGVDGDVTALYGTFSKAFAHCGSVVAGNEALIRYLRFYANSYAFSAATPPAVVGGLLAALRIGRSTPALRDRLKDNADYLRSGLEGLGFDTGGSNSHIVPIVVGRDRAVLYDGAKRLREHGLFIAPVDYPSVKRDSLRMRACVTAAHTQADLDEALSILEDVLLPMVRVAGAA